MEEKLNVLNDQCIELGINKKREKCEEIDIIIQIFINSQMHRILPFYYMMFSTKVIIFLPPKLGMMCFWPLLFHISEVYLALHCLLSSL